MPVHAETKPLPITPTDAAGYCWEICQLAPIVPALVGHDVAHAGPLGETLIRGGLPELEVTLRTPAALDVIRVMAQVPGGVSPGATDNLLTACEDMDLPLLLGAASASDVSAGARL